MTPVDTLGAEVQALATRTCALSDRVEQVRRILGLIRAAEGVRDSMLHTLNVLKAIHPSLPEHQRHLNRSRIEYREAYLAETRARIDALCAEALSL